MSRWPSDQWWADLQRFTDPDHLTTKGTTTMPDATESTDIDDWRYEVANGDTRLGLAEWIAHRDEADAVWQTLTPAAKTSWIAAMQPAEPGLTVCPECDEVAVTATAGPLPVCLACDWTGWPVDDTDEGWS